MSGFRYWDFRIEQKVFVLHLSTDGGCVIICERTRLASFELKVDVAAVVWGKETLEDALLSSTAGHFVRKYRGSNYVLIAERYDNQRGVFLKFSKVHNGGIRKIIVKGGRLLWGWKKLSGCLDNLVGKRLWKRGLTSKNIRSGNSLTVLDDQNKKATKDWRLAITIYRSNTRLSWKEINRKVEFITKRKTEISPVAADRAILGCLDEQELKGMLLMPE